MLNKLKIASQYIIPQHGISRLVGLLAEARLGRMSHALIAWFIKRYRVEMHEAELSQAHDYASFNDFFTRPLKAGARPIDTTANHLVHPVDGAVSQLGPISQGRIVQAKGHDYSACELLGGDETLASEFNAGDFATIYLSPRDYHRIHMPCAGTLRQMIYVPGQLFSVNPLTAENVPNLFARNERVVAIFDTEHGPLAMVLVGATIVASIETVWAGTVTPPRGKKVHRWDYQGRDIRFEKGQEMGRFKLGSTVVMLFAKDAIEFLDGLDCQSVTRMGQLMARTQK